MMNDRYKVSIALIIFYIPAALSAAVLLFYRHGTPRVPWGYLLFFTLVRIACGIVVILHEDQPDDVGLYIATVILLNVGLFPLLNATVGLLTIITTYDMKNDPVTRKSFNLSRILLIGGAALIIAGASSSTSNPSLGTTLAKVGYIIVAVSFASLVAIEAYLWRSKERISIDSIKILQGTLAAVPFLIVRIIYLFLSAFDPDHAKWNVLTGSIGPFVAMLLVMEYVTVVIYLLTGFRSAPTEIRAGFAESRELLTGTSD